LEMRRHLGLTLLLSDAPPRVPDLKPERNRRVHWSSLDTPI